MKAVRLLEYGGQLVFDEVPNPAIARDEILVKIKSTAVHHLDLVKASGHVNMCCVVLRPCSHAYGFGYLRTLGKSTGV